MQHGKFNVVTDGQWGSCGKGLVTTALADKHRPEIITTTNMANAGHTAVNVDGQKFVAKALPSATMLSKWLTDYAPLIVVGPSAAFDLTQMLHEINICGVEGKTVIHPRAGVILDKHKTAECDQNGTKHIASTMQGCGAFLSDKIMRRKDLKLARDYDELKSYGTDKLYAFVKEVVNKEPQSFPEAINSAMVAGTTLLHEGSQGFSLDINHGSHYPECTSRSTTAVQNMADMGVSPLNLGDIYLVIRPYPIRVGNVVENGQTVGYSGDCYSDHHELTWAEVAKAAGAPEEVMAGELTTVTKRLRRVFTFSERQLREAVTVNGATKIALNFANYVDWSVFGVNQYDRLSDKVKDYISKIEDIAGIPVTVVGTGPQTDHVCFLE